mgnify:CR=1 FL=1
MQDMEFAPVIIPTLNRYSHFKQCLESLEACTLADKTVVYVALDYPPSQKYVDGWKKIDNYLRDKESHNNFMKLIVYRRHTNCGVGGLNSNSNLLHTEMQEKYDCYIISEDDNVFSPNFLEYMNCCFSRFKNDDNIVAICGYTQPYPFVNENNSYFFHKTDMSCWGYGLWSSKIQKIEKEIKSGFFEKSFSVHNIIKIKKYGLNRLYQYLSYVLRNQKKYFWVTDCVISCYVILTDKYVINPTVSKVRNIGWDESGNSFKNPKVLKAFGNIPEIHKKQVIDNEAHFEFIGDPTLHMEENDSIAAKCSDGRMSGWQFTIAVIKFVIKKIIKK